MIKQLTVLLLLLCNFSFAQNGPVPTQFDKFIIKPGVQWAAYASDTFNFFKQGLNMMLLTRLNNNNIKASLPVESRSKEANKISFNNLDLINRAYYGDVVDYMMDSTGNTIAVKRPIPNMDSSNFSTTEITQVLYIEKGILKSYIPFVTPMLPVYTSTGMYIGQRFYFSTAFNYKYNYKHRKRNKLIFLEQTKKIIPLNPAQQGDMLKEMYGKNLLETIWPYVLENKIEAFSLESNRKLNPGELNTGIAYEQPVLVPVYDSAGNILRYEVGAANIEPNKFTDVQLVQDWYYDQKKNIVFTCIREMYVYLKEADKNIAPAFKLVFKQTR